jgi:hypothetical protein
LGCKKALYFGYFCHADGFALIIVREMVADPSIQIHVIDTDLPGVAK